MPTREAIVNGTSTASGRTRTPRIFSLGDRLLHDWVQILQPRCTAERLAAEIDVIRYRVVAEVDCIGEGAQSVGEIKLVPHHFTIVVRVGELSMHARVSPKVGGKQWRMQPQRVRDDVADAASGVINGCHIIFLQAKGDARARLLCPRATPQSAEILVRRYAIAFAQLLRHARGSGTVPRRVPRPRHGFMPGRSPQRLITAVHYRYRFGAYLRTRCRCGASRWSQSNHAADRGNQDALGAERQERDRRRDLTAKALTSIPRPINGGLGQRPSRDMVRHGRTPLHHLHRP